MYLCVHVWYNEQWLPRQPYLNGLQTVYCEVKGKVKVKFTLEQATKAQRGSRDTQSNLGSRTPRITNNSVYEQIFRTQSVSDDVLCLELRTRKPPKRRQKQITPDNFLVRQRPSGSQAESRGAKRQKKRKRIPFPTVTFHFLTIFHLRRQLSSIQVR